MMKNNWNKQEDKFFKTKEEKCQGNNTKNEVMNKAYSFISFALEYNLLTMLHSFINMHLQHLLLLNNFLSFALPASVFVTNNFTCSNNQKMKTWSHNIDLKLAAITWKKHTWASAFRTNMLHLLNHAWSKLSNGDLHSGALASRTSPWCTTFWAFPEKLTLYKLRSP